MLKKYYLFIFIFIISLNLNATPAYNNVSEFVKNKKMKVVRFLNNPLTTKSNFVQFDTNSSSEVSIESISKNGVRMMKFTDKSTSTVFSSTFPSGEVIDISSDGLLISTGIESDDNNTIIGDQLWLVQDSKKPKKYDITTILPITINNARFKQDLSISNHWDAKTSFTIQNKAIVVDSNTSANTYTKLHYNLVYKMYKYNVLMITSEYVNNQYQAIYTPNKYTNWQDFLSASNGKINSNDVQGLYNIQTMKKMGSLTCTTPSECSALDVPMYMNSDKTKLIIYTNTTTGNTQAQIYDMNNTNIKLAMYSSYLFSVENNKLPKNLSKAVRKTGQTTSYTANDDGYYQKGINNNFTRANDIVIDNISNIMWQDDSNVVRKPWVTQANYNDGNYSDTSGDTSTTYCTNLNLGGYTNWRLPTMKELLSIVDFGNLHINTKFKNYTSDSLYASSNSYPGTTNDNYTLFDYRMYHLEKYNDILVRCVRNTQ